MVKPSHSSGMTQMYNKHWTLLSLALPPMRRCAPPPPSSNPGV